MNKRILKAVSRLLAVAIIFSALVACISLPSSAAASLPDLRDDLGDYIRELFLKGPSVGYTVREKMKSTGLADAQLLADRSAFELSLCGANEDKDYSIYFFSDRDKFLSLFGNETEVFLEGSYYWYPTEALAKAAGHDVSGRNETIKLNLTSALNYALDVYGFCDSSTTQPFSTEFDNSRIQLVDDATACIYDILDALKDQIGAGSSKPTCYAVEYATTFCTESTGVYPYLETVLLKDKNENIATLSGYYDSDVYVEKTFSYAEIEKSPDAAAALAVFEKEYATLHKNDARVLYYDFRTGFSSVKSAYSSLCSALLSPSAVASSDFAAKGDAYLKIKGIATVFEEYIDNFSECYPASIDTIKANYAAMKTLIYHVGDNPFFVDSISLSAMVSLIERSTSSFSSFAPNADNVLSAQAYADGQRSVDGYSTFINKYKGVVGEENIAAYNAARTALDRLMYFSADSGKVSVPADEMTGIDGMITSSSFTFSFIPSAAAYSAFLNDTRRSVEAFYETVSTNLPTDVSDVEYDIFTLRYMLNECSFILGIYDPIVYPVNGAVLDLTMTAPAATLLKKTLAEMWKGTSVTDASLFEISAFMKAAAEYYNFKLALSSGFLNSEETSVLAAYRDVFDEVEDVNALLTRAMTMIEVDMLYYVDVLKYSVESAAALWDLTLIASAGTAASENYALGMSSRLSDGTDPSNFSNYKNGVFNAFIDAENRMLNILAEDASGVKGSTVLYMLADNALSYAVKALLGGEGEVLYDKFLYDLYVQISANYGKTKEKTYDAFYSDAKATGIELEKYIPIGADGNIVDGVLPWDYFEFTLAAVAKDAERAANIYAFTDNKIMTNLIIPLENIVITRVAYEGSYARDVSRDADELMDTAQNLINAVNAQSQSVNYEITIDEAEALLADLRALPALLASNSLNAIESYKASKLDAIIDRATAKVIMTSDTTPYYTLISNMFRDDYEYAKDVSTDKTATIDEIDEAVLLLSETLATLENYENASNAGIVKLTDLEAIIAEAEALYARYDLPSADAAVTALKTALDNAKTAYATKKSSFTPDELKTEVRLLSDAVATAEKAFMTGENLQTEINKITATVKTSSDYTTDSWKAYSDALAAATAAANSSSSKISVCENALKSLKAARALLIEAEMSSAETETPPPEQPTTPETPTEQTPPVTPSTTDSFYSEANKTYATHVADYAVYVSASGANAEKAASWKLALEKLRLAIDNRLGEVAVVECLVAVQLAKDIQVSNPETSDN